VEPNGENGEKKPVEANGNQEANGESRSEEANGFTKPDPSEI